MLPQGHGVDGAEQILRLNWLTIAPLYRTVLANQQHCELLRIDRKPYAEPSRIFSAQGLSVEGAGISHKDFNYNQISLLESWSRVSQQRFLPLIGGRTEGWRKYEQQPILPAVTIQMERGGRSVHGSRWVSGRLLAERVVTSAKQRIPHRPDSLCSNEV